MLDSTYFRQNGFIQTPHSVPLDRVEKALRAIENDLQKNYDPHRQEEYTHISSCPDLRHHDVITDLLRTSSLYGLLNDYLGHENIEYGAGQIAIRPPQTHTSDIVPHIDGIPTIHNGVKGQEIEPFTALVGFFLSDIMHDNAGNLVVWKGSHTRLESYFRKRGRKALTEGMPSLDLGTPQQLYARAGDAILCHYQLAHSVAPNFSTHNRIAVYFRLSLKNTLQKRWHALTHIWAGWKV